MATARAHIRLDMPADRVWAQVSDPDAIAVWLPNVATSKTTDGRRHVTTSDGTEVEEEIVTSDPDLRRFQYRLLPGPVPVEAHLATVDVIEDGAGCIIVYAVDVEPDFLGSPMQEFVDSAVAGLQAHLGI